MTRFIGLVTGVLLPALALIVVGIQIIGGWLPRGDEIAFTMEGRNTEGLYLLDVRKQVAARITFQNATTLVWSPDGSRLLYVAPGAVMSSGRRSFDVYQFDMHSGKIRPVVATPLQEVRPAWSPDGTRIAYTLNLERQFAVHLIDIDGSNDSGPLVGGAEQGYRAFAPVWSPDGTLIAFTGDLDSERGLLDIYLVEVASGQIARLTSESGSYRSLAWSPDGTTLIYDRGRSGTSDIYMLDVATGIERNLSNNIANDDFPALSPDGMHIAFRSLRGGNEDIFTVEVASGEVTRLVDFGVVDLLPAWSPDGTRIAFLSQSARSPLGVFVTDAAGGSVRTLWAQPGAWVFSFAWRPR